MVVFFASHGTVDPETREGFIVTYDSDPQDLSSTALPMEDLQRLVREELGRVKRVHIYVDVCHAARSAPSKVRRTVSTPLWKGLAKPMARSSASWPGRPREVSYEGPQFGGGHGAFSYFLLKRSQRCRGLRPRRRDSCGRRHRLRSRTGRRGHFSTGNTLVTSAISTTSWPWPTWARPGSKWRRGLRRSPESPGNCWRR